MTRAEVADLQTLARDFSIYRQETNDKFDNINQKLDLMIPKKWGALAIKFGGWALTTAIAIWGIIVLGHGMGRK